MPGGACPGLGWMHACGQTDTCENNLRKLCLRAVEIIGALYVGCHVMYCNFNACAFTTVTKPQRNWIIFRLIFN